jgi:hypothetical protein
MAWTVYADSYATSELTDTSKYQPVIFNKHLVLKAVRTWLVNYNNATFTNVSMKIYSDNSNAPKKLLYTSSNSPTKAEIFTDTNGVREFYFDFSTLPTLEADTRYHFVINASGYTGSESSHLAWLKAWPDPYYRTNLSVTFELLHTAPYALYFIGAEFE